MKRKNTIFIPIVFLSFLILFGSFYLISEEDYLLASVLASISLISLFIVYRLLKKGNQYTIDEHDDDYISLDNEQDIEEIDDEFDNTETIEETYVDEVIIEAIQEKEQSDEKQIKFKVIVNDDFEENIMSFISDMIEEDMFLESLEYKYSNEQIIKYNLLGENLYKYEFHPIPLVALIKDLRNENIIKLMIGINSKKMIHVGYIPQSHIETVKENYNSINNVKASLSGGNYKLLSSKSDRASEYIDPFIVEVSIYL